MLVLGHRTDVPDILAAVDVAVLASDFEGSPLAVLEYMEAGLPIVATRVGGVPELIEHGRDGLLVAPRSPEMLAEAVAACLTDGELAGRLGANARARRRREFDLTAMIDRLEALYLELWEAKHSRASENVRGPT